jgi:nucleoside-diphosphate-sugar epimerase
VFRLGSRAPRARAMRHRRAAPGIMGRVSETVVIFGATGPLGSRVVRLAEADPQVGRVVVLPADARPGDVGAETSLKDLLAEADVVIHLGGQAEVGPDGLPVSTGATEDLASTRALLAAASSAAVDRLVLLSSAMVYGAWDNNPIPLTEDAPLRPNPDLRYASARAESERLAFEWRAGRASATLAVLRPTVTVAAESASWLAASPWSASALRALGQDRPSQFLHLDDLATAVDHARRHGLDGPFNVSPDGWLSAEALAELAGPVGRLHLPAGLKGRWVSFRSQIGTEGAPEGWPYTRHSWVVANDRLRSTGWAPEHRNDEVYVEADPGGPLASLSPRRRQELSLLGVAVVAVGVGLGVTAWLVRRHRRG